MAYREDPIQRIVNVSWAGGIELEYQFFDLFFDEPGKEFACPFGDEFQPPDNIYFTIWNIKDFASRPATWAWGGTIRGETSGAEADFSTVCVGPNVTAYWKSVGGYYLAHWPAFASAELGYFDTVPIGTQLGFLSGETCFYHP